MIPTVGQVFDRLRFWMGDTEVSGGSVYTNSSTLAKEAIAAAYEDAFNQIRRLSLRLVQREGYFVLPAFSGTFLPAQAGISNFGLPQSLHFRRPKTGFPLNITIASISGSDLLLTLSAVHNLSNGDLVEIYSLAGMNEQLQTSHPVYVTALPQNQLKILNVSPTGTYTSGGKLVRSTEAWSNPIPVVSDSVDWNQNVNQFPFGYRYQGGRFRFPPSSVDLELKLIYTVGSTIDPTQTSLSLGIEGSLSYISLRAAWYCCEARPIQSRTKSKEIEAKMSLEWESLRTQLALSTQLLDSFQAPEQFFLHPDSELA